MEFAEAAPLRRDTKWEAPGESGANRDNRSASLQYDVVTGYWQPSDRLALTIPLTRLR
jgi:hypothetical protein